MATEFAFKFTTGLFRSIIDSLAVGIYVLDRELRIQWANVKASRWLNKKDFRQFKGRFCYEVFLEKEEPCDGCPVLRAYESARTERLEMKLERGGEERYFLLTATPLWNRRRTGEFVYVVEMVQEITKQKKTEEELRRLNKFNRAIIDNAPIAIFTLDKNGVFTSVNPALASISGLGLKAEEKLIGFNWLQNAYTRECGLARYIEEGLKGKPFELRDFPFITYRGDKRLYMDFKGVPLKNDSGEIEGLLCIIEETTERVKARAQLIQQAKLSAVGRLATGVAHELNNPLATIAAHGELACDILESFEGLEESEELKELKRCLEVIQSQAFRCKKIIENLMSLARKESFEPRRVALEPLLDELLELLNFKKLGIFVEKRFETKPLNVLGDPSALRQAFLSLMHNAIDAVEGVENPRIEVVAKRVGDFAEVDVRDNGVGIPPDIVDKIFDPFFTTKGSRKNTGLGLTLSYEFLSEMGGTIEVESEPGKGSTFKVLIPIYKGEGGDGSGPGG